MVTFLRRQWFLVALVLVLGVGFGGSGPLAELARYERSRQALVAVVMFLMALPLDARSIGRALRFPAAVLLATGISYGLVPLLAWGVAFGWGYGGLLPADLGAGLMISAAIPCTIASAAVWTRRAGGNDSVAQLVTVLTNLLCFLVAPFWLWVSTRKQIEVSLGKMMFELAVLVVLPMSLAQTFRLWPAIAAAATRRKTALGACAQAGILVFVLVGAIRAGNSLRDTMGTSQAAIGAGGWLGMLLAVAGVHVAALAAGFGLARLLGLSRADGIAVAFSGSQKTLAVGLAIAHRWYPGLALLPMIAYHVSQLMLDTVIADRLARNKPA